MVLRSLQKSMFPIEPARSALLSELWEEQLLKKYIPRETLHALAIRHNLSEIEVEGVASFYHFFHGQPAGKHTIYLNNSIISEIRGYDRIKEAFERETGAHLNSVDPGGTFGLFETPCIGLSDQEPACLIDFFPFTNLNALKVKAIIQKLKQGNNTNHINKMIIFI